MKYTRQSKNSFRYSEYYEMTEQLVAEGKTTGTNQDQVLVDFTTLNLQRMKRLNKTIKLNEAIQQKLNQLQQPQRWIVISEAWCGDAAQNLPILNVLASASKHIDLEIILRDENLEIMDDFLTNGGRSIPKLISVDHDDNVLFTWGPRPQKAQDLYIEHKKNPDKLTPEAFKLSLHTWYVKDKGQEVQNEFLDLL
jgi:hypothetical protein